MIGPRSLARLLLLACGVAVAVSCGSSPPLLSGELVGREEFQLQPAETRQYRRQLQPDTKFIGVVGAFRDLEQARWRQAVPVPSKRSPTITIGLQARAVTVAVK